MYDIGTILKVRASEYAPPGAILTGIVIGYSFTGAQPKNVILWYKDVPEDGIFGIMSLNTYELVTRSEVCGKCDLSAFLNVSKHLENISSFLSKREDNLQEALDSLHQSQQEIEKYIEQNK